MEFSIFEILGMIGTLLVFFSYTRTNIMQIRIINLVGSIFFVIYGCCISAWSTAILNFACIFVQIYHIRKLKKLNDEGRKEVQS